MPSPLLAVRLISRGPDLRGLPRCLLRPRRSGAASAALSSVGDSRDSASAQRERTHTVSSFYNQAAIDDAAAKKSVHLTPSAIMYTGAGRPEFLLKSANYLRKELPVRLAHRISEIRALPFIVGCNPTILAVHELYIKAFHRLNAFTEDEIETHEQEERFSQTLRQFLDDHKDVISMLAQGFKECRKHVQDEEVITRYLDRNMSSRLAVRMLCTHQLMLRDKDPDYMGLIKMRLNLKEIVEEKVRLVETLMLDRYGFSPKVEVVGHTSAVFPYIQMPLDYILPELLKNALRATVEQHAPARGASAAAAGAGAQLSDHVPPVRVTLASNAVDFIVRISDRGGGIPHDRVEQVFKYNFTTAEESTERLMENENIFGGMMEAANRSTSGPMHGFGFGLPVSRAYATYLGGSLILNSMQGFGTDAYLRLKHFDPKSEEIRI